MLSSYTLTQSPLHSTHAERETPQVEIDHHLAYLPTAEQIMEECKRIREGWSKADQHRQRAGATAADYSEETNE